MCNHTVHQNEVSCLYIFPPFTFCLYSNEQIKSQRFRNFITSGFDRVDLQKGIKNYGSLYLACNDRKAFFTSSDQSRYTLWSCQNVCDALSYLLDNIYIRFGTKLYRQIVRIPMGTNCAPLVADLFLYCYERDFMDSLNHDNQANVIEAFNSTSRYLDDLLNIDNPYFEGMVNQIYPPELQLNKANISDIEAPFLDLHLSVTNGLVSSKI